MKAGLSAEYRKSSRGEEDPEEGTDKIPWNRKSRKPLGMGFRDFSLFRERGRKLPEMVKERGEILLVIGDGAEETMLGVSRNPMEIGTCCDEQVLFFGQP